MDDQGRYEPEDLTPPPVQGADRLGEVHHFAISQHFIRLAAELLYPNGEFGWVWLALFSHLPIDSSIQEAHSGLEIQTFYSLRTHHGLA